MNIYARRLSFKVGSLIIITEVIVLLALGVFYSARFTSDINFRFEYQIKTPGLLMSKGLLKYETVRDKSTMEGIVGDTVSDCMVIGANQKVYYSMNQEDEGKQLSDIVSIHKFDEFNKEITETVIQNISEGDKSYVVSLSPLRFRDGKFMGYLYSKINAVNLNHTKKSLVVIFILGTFLCIIISSIAIIYLFNKFIVVKIQNILLKLDLLKEGNLNSDDEMEVSEDELGRISKSVKDLKNRLRKIIENINEGATNLTKASADLNNNSSSMSNTSSQLATIAEEVASSMEEMSVNTQQNAENAFTTSQISQGAKRGNRSRQTGI
jgi:methyl-accepting chemotaxis protein